MNTTASTRWALVVGGFVCVALYGLVAVLAMNDNFLSRFDRRQAERFYQSAQNHPALNDFALGVTDLGGGRTRTIIVATVAVLLLLDRQWRVAIIWGLAQWFFPEIVAQQKLIFEKPRPSFPDAAYVAGGFAFPSGHAAGVMATYGMLAVIIAGNWPRRLVTWPVLAVVSALVLAVGFSRMLLGVHWFSDVLGGYLLALGYIAFVVALMRWRGRD
jgi:undecaprenyl-diphosphatase